MEDNLKLKWFLIMQSFFPLALLLFVKYMDCDLVKKTAFWIAGLWKKADDAHLPEVLDKPFIVVLLVMCSVWILVSILAGFQLRGVWKANFIDHGEKIRVQKYITDGSVLFYMTILFPLIMDDLGEKRNFVLFMIIMVLLIRLMWRTNLYYQNPVLTILGYRVFEFEFKLTKDDSLKNKMFIGITRGMIHEEKIIKRQFISDNVFLIYNKNPGGGKDA